MKPTATLLSTAALLLCLALPVPADAGNPEPAAAAPRDLEQRCAVPAEIEPEQLSLPGLAAALRESSQDRTIVILSPHGNEGPESIGGVPAYPIRLQGRLAGDLGDLAGRKRIPVETVGKKFGAVGEMGSLISKQVLALKPALVVWQVGRADARRGIPTHRFDHELSSGLDLLKDKGIDTIVIDIQYHPQFEALYRTDEYRQHLRQLAGIRNLPLLRRYQMVEYWQGEGRIDLDSGAPDVQQASVDFIQDCIAFQLSRMIAAGVRAVP